MSRLMSRLMVMGLAFGVLLLAAPASAQVKCDPKTQKCVEVNCSPGYWKNHVEVWCPVTGEALICAGLTTECGGACTCEQLRHFASAEEGATAAQRAAVDSCLDTFFSFTAGFSPCSD